MKVRLIGCPAVENRKGTWATLLACITLLLTSSFVAPYSPADWKFPLALHSNEVLPSAGGGDFQPQTPSCTNCVIANISLGSSPAGIVYDNWNKDIYVANGTVSVISGSTNTIVGTVSLGGPSGPE